MWQRTSKVDNIHINYVSFSGVLQLGEAKYVNSYRLTFALQREHELFFGKEAPLTLFRKFYSKQEFEPIYENIRITFHHRNPCICVRNISMIALSNDAIMHIGNGDYVDLESKTLNIRQLSSWSGYIHELKKTEAELSPAE